MISTNDTNIKRSIQKIAYALWESLLNTDWKLEIRYFITVVVGPSIIVMIVLFLFGYNKVSDAVMVIFFWMFLWLAYKSYGTTHELRKNNIKDFFKCLDPYAFDSPPSISRQSLSMKHCFKPIEFLLFSVIQRSNLIFGLLIMVTVMDVILIIRYPHLDKKGLIFLYIIGSIAAICFYVLGYYEDMEKHYVKIFPNAKKLLIKYTFYVLLASAPAIYMLYILIFRIVRLMM